jgi:hypothetical protein
MTLSKGRPEKLESRRTLKINMVLHPQIRQEPMPIIHLSIGSPLRDSLKRHGCRGPTVTTLNSSSNDYEELLRLQVLLTSTMKI